MSLSILYRGPLSSCNYGCVYCPFAKHHESAEELARDRRALERFVEWVSRQRDLRLSVFFTPWGEALIRKWYRDAIIHLSHMPHVAKAAVQTNLSCGVGWLADCALDRVGLWCTWHPGEVSMARFLERCRRLDRLGARYSVGMVGLKEHFGAIEAIRAALPKHVYLWINAYKREPDYYREADRARLEAVDPLFRFNAVRHPSRGRLCRTGDTVISVDGDGAIRRCHFIPAVLGNIYDEHWRQALRPRACTNDTCGCHIGYVHLPELGLEDVFGAGLLERIPAGPAAEAPSEYVSSASIRTHRLRPYEQQGKTQ